MNKTILVVDDEASIRKSLSSILTEEGYRVLEAASGIQALEVLKNEEIDATLLDIWMPGMDGLETLKRIQVLAPQTLVVMMSGHGTIETAVKATKLGAFDFLEKPPSLERLLVVLQNGINVFQLRKDNESLRKQIRSQRRMIGSSSVMLQLQDTIHRVAPTTGSVLITGENGTGKELIAHMIHSLSPRFAKPMIAVNCAAIPEELIESELFGHERGAFTGAHAARKGKFDLADGGTLFLDEIGDMSLRTQAKVLRILQEQKFERVGGNQTYTVDVRVVAATNKDLKQEIAKGNFREDLFYRLNVVPFHVPPLRDRKDDIAPLCEHFLKEFSRAHDRPFRALDPEALQLLKDYLWPGNVRELKNLMERLVILSHPTLSADLVSADELLKNLGADMYAKDQDITTKSSGSSALGSEKSETTRTQIGRNLREARSEFEREFILGTLQAADWNVSKAAQILGIERSHLHKKIKSYGIENPKLV